jgi:hypothetical protein
MKRFQSILCASLLTLAMSSAALAGNISGAPSKDGNISGKGGNISGAPGNISGTPGNISGTPGNISGFTEEAYLTLLGLLGTIVP